MQRAVFGINIEIMKEMLFIPKEWNVVSLCFNSRKHLVVIEVAGENIPAKRKLRGTIKNGEDGRPSCCVWTDGETQEIEAGENTDGCEARE